MSEGVESSEAAVEEASAIRLARRQSAQLELGVRGGTKSFIHRLYNLVRVV